MNDEQLMRNLQSVGKSCFVKYFDEFASPTTSREDVIKKLMSESDYTEKSCVSRTSHARSIIAAGLAEKALKKIVSSDSPLVPRETREKANELLKMYN
ncbi:hypothetical protein GCM10007392_46610 [Saccharospirillum salsuginis]|uniref:Uncharacterized protein n=1 Tax=Saccharospirillum salsuginis TaxID=418750 RepID=A0A918KUD6_9GAMM|nr:hypothetical protein GCM10007392_46610 [Saccharospirillum salsuginis]